jgi:hypothetical protein
LKIGRQDAKDLPVDVIDRGGEEQQRADHPAPAADARAGVR